MLVIAVCGLKCSGKDEIGSYIEKKYGFEHLDYTKHITTPLLKREGKEITRDNQVELVSRLRKQHGIDVLTRTIVFKVHGNSVISGVRYKEEVSYLRKHFKKDFKLIGVTADDQIRYERSKKRKTKGEEKHTFEEFLDRENLPTEIVIPQTMKLADFTVENNSARQELYEKIDKIMEQLLTTR